jgi:hypothetical protein
MDNNNFDQELATSINDLSFNLNDLRVALAHNPSSTIEGYVDFSVRLGCLAGRAGFSAAVDFMESLLAVKDLTDAEIALLADISETLGGGGE